MSQEPKEKPQLSDPEEPEDGVPIALVTGASGYVATHIIRPLLEQGRVRVRGTVRNLENEKKVQPLREIVPNPKYPLRLIEADLVNPRSWTEVVKRCTYVYHVASPVSVAVPKNPDEIVKPAVEGTVNVLTACKESGTVKRVVITSSLAAVCAFGDPGKPKDHVYTENDWSVPELFSIPYMLSKYEAERAAWGFVKNLEEGKRFELVTCCPGYVMGPLLSPTSGNGSARGCIIFLNNEVPAIPDFYTPVIDVRDAATAHIAAMEKPEAAGNRYLLVADTLSFKEIADNLRGEFQSQGYKIPHRSLPHAIAWVLKFFSSEMKFMYPALGVKLTCSNAKMKETLGVTPRPVRETIVDMGYSVIEFGLVPKKSGYLGPPSKQRGGQ
jgi:nucleoside-diphosphate-sugar epimerase